MTRLLTAMVLAVPQPGDSDPSTGRGPEWGKAAPIGLLVILMLAVAVVFLLRSFTRQLKKVPASFDQAVGDPVPIEADAQSQVHVSPSAGGIGRAPSESERGPTAPEPDR